MAGHFLPEDSLFLSLETEKEGRMHVHGFPPVLVPFSVYSRCSLYILTTKPRRYICTTLMLNVGCPPCKCVERCHLHFGIRLRYSIFCKMTSRHNQHLQSRTGKGWRSKSGNIESGSAEQTNVPTNHEYPGIVSYIYVRGDLCCRRVRSGITI